MSTIVPGAKKAKRRAEEAERFARIAKAAKEIAAEKAQFESLVDIERARRRGGLILAGQDPDEESNLLGRVQRLGVG
jgi:hypothetical protein